MLRSSYICSKLKSWILAFEQFSYGFEMSQLPPTVD